MLGYLNNDSQSNLAICSPAKECQGNCSVAGTFIRFTAAAVNITVLDDNDNAPLFINAPYSATLLEGPFANTTPILNVSAEDADSGTNGEVVYSLAGGESEIFQLDPNTVSQSLYKNLTKLCTYRDLCQLRQVYH